VSERAGEGLHYLFETFHRGGDGELHLLDLPLVLEQAQLGEGFAELLVQGIEDAEVQVVRVLGGVVPGGVHQGVDVLVHLADQADGDAADFGGAHILGDGRASSWSMWAVARPRRASNSASVGRAPIQNSPDRESA
jgi:hypothetical protein